MAGPSPLNWIQSAERFASGNGEWWAWLIAALGLYLRIQAGYGTYFHSDEAWIVLTAQTKGLANLYRAGLVHNYGPLMNFGLHFLSLFGSSELYFRMPGIVAGALTPVVVYRWGSETFGKAAGLAAACIVGLSPELIILSAQVRHYAVQMLFMTLSLYCLERAFREKSARWMRWFGVSLLLALLALYMSMWFIGAVGVYALVRIARRELPRRLVVEWAAIQVLLLGVMVVAWFTHLRRFAGSAAEQFAQEGWLRASYFHAGDSVFDFVLSGTRNVFDFVLANPILGGLSLLVFGAGVFLLLRERTSRVQSLILVLPFAVTAAAGLLALYPYGGTRHDSFLAVFVAAGIGVAIAAAVRGKVLAVLVAAACFTPLWMAVAGPNVFDDRPVDSKLEQMQAMLDFLPSRQPPVKTFVVDLYSAWILKYYVCRGDVGESRTLTNSLETYRCGNAQVLSVGTWNPPFPTYLQGLQIARARWPELFPDSAWAFFINFGPASGVRPGQRAGEFGKLELYRLSP